MAKIKFNRFPLIYPMPAVVIGSSINNKPTFTTIGNCGVMNVNPAIIYISMEKKHYINKGIRENGVFSINIPSVDLIEKVDYCGIVSGNNIDKSYVFESSYESNNKIPLIKECPINMECKVLKVLDIYDMEVFISEIIESYVDQDMLTNGFPDTKKIDPLIYCMDNNYWKIGSSIGDAFKIGENIK